MNIYDKDGNPIHDPDLNNGRLYRWFKLNTPDQAYEEAYIYEPYTQADREEMASEKEWLDKHEWLYSSAESEVETANDAIADMSEIVSEDSVNIADLEDALADLSRYISEIAVF